MCIYIYVALSKSGHTYLTFVFFSLEPAAKCFHFFFSFPFFTSESQTF